MYTNIIYINVTIMAIFSYITLFCNRSRILNELDERQAKQLLLKLVEREPGVVFDIMKDPEQCEVDLWHSCSHCLDIADIERLCCNMHANKCISLRPVRCVLLQYIRVLWQE